MQFDCAASQDFSTTVDRPVDNPVSMETVKAMTAYAMVATVTPSADTQRHRPCGSECASPPAKRPRASGNTPVDPSV